MNISRVESAYLAVLLLFVFSPVPASADWPMFKAWPERTSLAADAGPTNLSSGVVQAVNLSWPVYSSPVVAGGFVYVGTDGGLYQLDAGNVSVVRAFLGNGQFSASAAVSGGYVYAAKSGVVYQLDAANISVIVANFSFGGAINSSPAVAGGFVYVATVGGVVYQLNASNVSLAAANFTSGAGAFYSSPAVFGGRVYLGDNAGNFYQLDAANVSVLEASLYAGGTCDFQSSPAVSGGYVYVGSFGGCQSLYQLDASNVSLVYAEFVGVAGFKSSPAVSGGSVYVGSNDNIVRQLSAANVSVLLRSYATGNAVVSSPAVSGGSVYVGGYDGGFYQLGSSNVSVRSGHHAVGHMIHSSPAVSGGVAYVGDLDGWFYAFGDNPAPPTISSSVNQSVAASGSVLVVSGSIVGGAAVLDSWWFEYNGTAGPSGPASAGSDSLLWDTSGLHGNYSVVGVVNDSAGNVGYSGASFVYVAEPPSFSSFSVNQSEAFQGGMLEVRGDVVFGDFPPGWWWLTANGSFVGSGGASLATNVLAWDTSTYLGNYSVRGWVNDTGGLIARSGEFYVNIATSTTTTTSSSTSTTVDDGGGGPRRTTTTQPAPSTTVTSTTASSTVTTSVSTTVSTAPTSSTNPPTTSSTPTTSLRREDSGRPQGSGSGGPAASCRDGLMGGVEEGVDCGGPCPPCAAFNVTLDLDSRHYVEPGERFEVKATLSSQTDVLGLGVSLSAPEGFSVSPGGLRVVNLFDGAGAVYWEVEATDDVADGRYSLTVGVADRAGAQRSRSDSQVVVSRPVRVGVGAAGVDVPGVSVVQERTFALASTIFSVLYSGKWEVLAAAFGVGGLLYAYFRARRRGRRNLSNV
jgi:outer membrane protein assembly factor BamB